MVSRPLRSVISTNFYALDWKRRGDARRGKEIGDCVIAREDPHRQ